MKRRATGILNIIGGGRGGWDRGAFLPGGASPASHEKGSLARGRLGLGGQFELRVRVTAKALKPNDLTRQQNGRPYPYLRP